MEQSIALEMKSQYQNALWSYKHGLGALRSTQLLTAAQVSLIYNCSYTCKVSIRA